jgi:hypothetical protein
MPRINSKVSAGEAGTKGSVLGRPKTPLPRLAEGDTAIGFQEVNISTVVGGPKAGKSLHRGAPDGGRAGGSMPETNALGGHQDISAAAATARGNSPKRSAGKKTPANPTDVT